MNEKGLRITIVYLQCFLFANRINFVNKQEVALWLTFARIIDSLA